MKRDLRFERFLKHPPERIWKALTDPQALAGWYMENDFRPVVGHRFQFRTEAGPGFDGILHCQVMVVEEPYRLAYTFRGGRFLERETLVTWTLTRQHGGTLLRLEHTGFTGFSTIAMSFIIGFGWWRFLKQLPAFLDTVKHH
jgi:uncharacterized protein YndB with AHSA1/START domain